MKRKLLSLVAIASVSVATPGFSQNPQSINQRQAAIDARIDAGVRQGDLTQAEARRLRAEFADIVQEERRYRASRRGLTPAERAALDSRLDELSRRIAGDRRDNQRRGDNAPINERQRQLEARIDAGVRQGTLSRREAAEARREFQSIVAAEDAYRRSGRGLTPQERRYLDDRLDRLERRVRQDRRDDDYRWTNLDQRQASFDQQLDQAVRERRVNAREAAALRAEFRAISRLERQYRRSRPGITAAERLDLNRRFDRMEANFRASMTPSDNLFDLLFGLTR